MKINNHKKQNINSNITSKKSITTVFALNDINIFTSAYYVDISKKALAFLNNNIDIPIAIYNTNALMYTNNLKIINKKDS